MTTRDAGDFWLADEAPPWWHRARAVYDAAVHIATHVNLPATLTLAAALGRTLHRVTGRSPSAADIGRLFPDRSADELRRIAREIAALRYQNRVRVVRAMRGGRPGLGRPIAEADLAALEPLRSQGPAILLTWHVGPLFALSHALSRLRFPVMMLRRTHFVPVLPGVELVATDGDSDERAAALARAIAHVRRGGFVLMAPDTLGTARTMPVPCLGRAVPLACGAFALARLTGVPIVPLAGRQDEDGTVRLELGAPLTFSREQDVERALAAAAAAWYEAYLRKWPGQLWLRSVRWFLDAPPLTP